jgi:putative flippase GtrA
MSEEGAKRGLVGKLRRFAVVGFANTAIDLAVFTVMLKLIGMAFVSNLIAWCAAVVFSFAANSLWSFDRDRDKPVAHSFFQFVSLGALTSLGVSNLSIALLAGMIGVWPAKLLALVIIATLNFAAAKWSIEGRLFGERVANRD